MTNNKKSKLRTQAQEDKAIFIVRVIRISYNPRIFIKNAVFASAKETPCFFRFTVSFRRSHSNYSPSMALYCCYIVFTVKVLLLLGFDAYNVHNQARRVAASAWMNC
jgi:hypothetical protein